MRSKVVLAAAAIAAGVAASASADTVSVVYVGTSGNFGKSVEVSLSGGLTFQDGSSSRSVWAGELTHIIDGVTARTYCTELTQWAGSGLFEQVTVDQAPNPGSGMGAEKADAIHRLFNATNRGADVDSNTKAAAFQAVIWEIVYDFDGAESDLSVGSGKVEISGVSSTWFNTYRSFASGNGDKTPRVVAMINQDRQDQLRVVPLPGAAAMAGLGLLGLSVRRRRA